jgi:hypothetical protein
MTDLIELTQAKKRLNFDYTYKQKGGVAKLIELREAGVSLRDAAKHFEVSFSYIAQSYKAITGEAYGKKL